MHLIIYRMKVTAILKGRKDDQGRQTVCIRISEGQDRKFKALTLRVATADFKKGVVLPSHPSHKAYNLKIREEILSTERKGGFDKKENTGPLFLDYCETLIVRWGNLRRPPTIRYYNSEVTKFRYFADDYTVEQITPQVLRAYLDHCYALGNTENTAWKTFKFLKTVINKAVKEGLIKDNPFFLFDSPKYRDPKKQYLTTVQIKKIEGVLKKPLPESVTFAATWFLIGCYSGLRFSDMHTFSKKHNIVSGRLVVYTGKTLEVVSMPVSDHLKGLFESIQYKPMRFNNAHYNKLLKKVGAIAKVDITLTAHVSRHTAAIRWANAGISQEVTGKLLGHTNLRTTAIYFKLTNKRIDDELKGLD